MVVGTSEEKDTLGWLGLSLTPGESADTREMGLAWACSRAIAHRDYYCGYDQGVG